MLLLIAAIIKAVCPVRFRALTGAPRCRSASLMIASP
jgi:hypothetical protein